MIIGFSLNGKKVTIDTDPQRRLLDIIRSDFGLTGTKAGCYNGECGSCSILLDGEVVPSCMIPVFTIEGREIMTIEGFSQTRDFTDIERGFLEAGTITCGFCAPGKVFAVHALIEGRVGERDEDPSAEELRLALSGNLCRCEGRDDLNKAVGIAEGLRRRRYRGKKRG